MMESLIGHMILNRRAADMCVRISPRADCMALANIYRANVTSLSGDMDMAVAIEAHVRMMAQSHFEDASVIEALALVDAAKAYRAKITKSSRAKMRRKTR